MALQHLCALHMPYVDAVILPAAMHMQGFVLCNAGVTYVTQISWWLASYDSTAGLYALAPSAAVLHAVA